MSADNGIYILRSKSEWITNGVARSRTEPYYIYRVAHNQAMDNYYWYLNNQIYNLGWYLWTVFKDSFNHMTHESAMYEAKALEQAYGYTEYGIVLIEYDKVFPGD